MEKPVKPADNGGMVILGIALVAAAWALGHQIASIRLADRTIQVKGAAEMPVTADSATWTLGTSASGNTLAEVQPAFTASLAKTREFLQKYGITADEIEPTAVNVNDAAANSYSNQNGPRFTLNGGLTVRTANLGAVQQAKNNLGALVGQGVVLSNSYGPNYTFSKLNEVKPQLTSKATQAARSVALQFAKDTDVNLGDIRSARQGSVEILGRDSFLGENEQINKVLRVVTTVDYNLN